MDVPYLNLDVPYLMHVPDGDELWLVDGKQRLLITPRIYDLLASNGADLPPAYGIEELCEQNAKLREVLKNCVILLTDHQFTHLPELRHETFKAIRDLGIEVD